ncbi:MAG TPA: adenylate/guanylate cyclase domain-containing protein [Nocardioidaceae bacterium]|nr:adenylate/guanylate cyclase domain-containing protein [Nocardioidaceae bacterium]
MTTISPPMRTLPSGTVTLLFSDIEGSTALLSRLGPAYADALDSQREIMRRAWSEHGGVELGTEGDSFYVVFETAPQAVEAAAQAQRDLAAQPWPGDETLRVRIGMHTGTPAVHGDAYVGLDVHRAARIAAAAHGGQVIVSSSTAALVGPKPSVSIRLDDLGAHRLKDFPMPERLYQLTVDGLERDFPGLRTLGAASRLPSSATPLIGRDADVADIVSRVASGTARLLTLTGPGGTGKTRLAVAVAEQLADGYDGVFFVALAMNTTAESAWAALGEQLDVPDDRRSPDELLQSVAGRNALYVLDNLEQLDGADDLALRLLGAADRSAVIATSRRPLHVEAEHEHSVAPLDLPGDDSVELATASPAVQLFAQHARRSQPRFTINAENAADVVEICRRLDGLPLAIELAAARAKLLSPKALLARLDRVLDLGDAARQRPSRQRTLRDTITVSYELLSEPMQTAFRRLGVFAGGADLAAVEAVSCDARDDPLDLVAELVDASLVSVGEGVDGEPRIELLATVRAYAREALRDNGELDETRWRHASHYASTAKDLSALLLGSGWLDARARFEEDDANIREAVAWAMPDDDPHDPERTALGVRLLAEAGLLWASTHGYIPGDSRGVIERAIGRGDTADSSERARLLLYLGTVLVLARRAEEARAYLEQAIAMMRRVGDDMYLVSALNITGMMEADLGRHDASRELYDESVAVAMSTGNLLQLRESISNLAWHIQSTGGDHEVVLQLKREALEVAKRTGNPYAALADEHNVACSLRILGRLDEAYAMMRPLIPTVLAINVTGNVMATSEDFAALLADMGDSKRAAWLLGAADARHDEVGQSRLAQQDAEIAEPIAKARAALTPAEWDDAYTRGRATPIHEAMRQAYDETSEPV